MVEADFLFTFYGKLNQLSTIGTSTVFTDTPRTFR